MWTEEERGILTLKVRGETHKLDPTPLWRRYKQGLRRVTYEAFQEGLKQILRGEETPQLADLCMPVIRETLGWKSFAEDAEHGYTEEELLVAFTQFIEWLVTSKKKAESLPSSVGPAGDSVETPPSPSTAPLSSVETSSSPEEPGKLQPA